MLLPISNFKWFSQLVEVEKFMLNDADWRWIADDEMPPFHFEERIGDCTTEVAQPVSFNGYDDLEEIAGSDDWLVFYFELAFEFEGGEVLETFFDVGRPVGVKQTEEVISFFFFFL